MPKYPYKQLGVGLDRNYRNDLNQNFKDIESDIKNTKVEISEKVYQDVINAATLNWKEPVSSQSNLPGGASEGDTRMARDTGKVYRFNGSVWVEIQQIDAGPVNELDTRLSSELAQKATKQELTSGLAPKAEKTQVDAMESDLNNKLSLKANQDELNTEKGRIDNLVANAGDTDGNAELLDIRVGWDGVLYPTAGDAVRSIQQFMTEENEEWVI